MTVLEERTGSEGIPPTALAGGRERTFDGVICFGGGDWWYHNRGHYDMQMMRELSRVMPVLHVNSLGVRVPGIGEGKMFFRRMRRKLKSLTRGFVKVRERFGVVSPFVVPGKVGMTLSRRLLAPQVRLAAWRMGIRRPVVWVTCPPAAEVIDDLNAVGVVYQRTDRWEAFPWAVPEAIKGYDRKLKEKADLVLYCSTLLHEEEARQCRRALYVDHGVDFESFAAAGEDPGSEPADVKPIARPRIGFIGGIDSHTFDPPLFLDVARRMPEAQFVLVGACSLPQDWCTLPNVTLLGQRPYETVPGYMAACDVLIMPWNQSEWIQACNPVKLKEYLAVGRPVVTTDFAELRRYEGYVRRASGAEDFVQQIRQALADRPDPARLRERVRQETWQAKAGLVLAGLVEAGIKCSCMDGTDETGRPLIALSGKSDNRREDAEEGQS